MEKIAEGIYVSTEYGGVNVGAIVSERGVLCIDVPSYPADARNWANRVNQLSARSVRCVILTDAQGDRILNTRWLNGPLIMQQAAAETLSGYEKRFPSSLIESLTIRNQHAGKELSATPVDRPSLSFSREMTLFADDRPIKVMSMPGPSYGSAWVYVPDAGILFAGDSVIVNQHPHWSEPTTKSWLENLASLQGPHPLAEVIVPGRGPLSSPGAVEGVSDYLVKVRSEVGKLIETGVTKDQVARRAALLMNEFPVDELPYDWVYRQVGRSLVALYDELKADAEKFGQDNGNPSP